MSGFLPFLISLLSLGTIYAILCLALNLESGVGGLWDLGIVSFFGIGAYTYTILTAAPAADYQAYLSGFGLPMWVGVPAAAVVAGACALLIAQPTLKLKREYFLITTLAFSEVIRQVFVNEAWLTNGVAGIYGLAQPLRGSVDPSVHSLVLLAIFGLGLLLAFLLLRHLTLSPFGRTLRALRENEALAITAGISPHRYNMLAYVIAGAMSGVAGVFFVWYNTLVTPAQFSNDITFFVWTALIIGGLGSLRGALVGGFVFILLHDLLRFVSVSGELAGAISALRTVVIGLALILILRWRPDGLFPERATVFSASDRGYRGSASRETKPLVKSHA